MKNKNKVFLLTTVLAIFFSVISVNANVDKKSELKPTLLNQVNKEKFSFNNGFLMNKDLLGKINNKNLPTYQFDNKVVKTNEIRRREYGHQELSYQAYLSYLNGYAIADPLLYFECFAYVNPDGVKYINSLYVDFILELYPTAVEVSLCKTDDDFAKFLYDSFKGDDGSISSLDITDDSFRDHKLNGYRHVAMEQSGFYETHNYKNRQNSYAAILFEIKHMNEDNIENFFYSLITEMPTKYYGKIIRAYQTDIGTFLLIDSNGEKILTLMPVIDVPIKIGEYITVYGITTFPGMYGWSTVTCENWFR